jgi:hypothetical protein
VISFIIRWHHHLLWDIICIRAFMDSIWYDFLF